MATTERLPTGAELRVTGPADADTVVCVDGGSAGDVAGTWSAALEWLVRHLAPDFPELRFAEVRYRVKSWRHLERCIEDAEAALEVTGARRTLLLGYSMGGAVAIAVAGHPAAVGVVGLAPWIPDRLDLSGLDGKRLVVLHGALDRGLPGIPGVSPGQSRRGFERARERGVDGSYTTIPLATHAIALRVPWGTAVAVPRAGRWATLVADELRRFRAGAAAAAAAPATGA